jgi:hypothetical protein
MNPPPDDLKNSAAEVTEYTEKKTAGVVKRRTPFFGELRVLHG